MDNNTSFYMLYTIDKKGDIQNSDVNYYTIAKLN